MRRLAAAILSLSFAALAAAPAQAQTAAAATTERRLDATYSIRARGMNAGEFTYHFSQNGAAYEATATRRITGALRALAGRSQDYDYSTRGSVASGGVLRPSAYRHSGGRRGRVVNVAFGQRIVTTTNPPGMGMGDPPATEAQKVGSIDQLSAIASMIVAQGDPCSRTIKVYLDGRARFDFVMSPNGTVNANTAGYRGEAIRCSVQYRPIAGFGDPQEPATLTFLFARTTSGMYAPVRIEMPTDDAGVVTLEARSISVNGTRLR